VLIPSVRCIVRFHCWLLGQLEVAVDADRLTLAVPLAGKGSIERYRAFATRTFAIGKQPAKGGSRARLQEVTVPGACVDDA